MNLEFWKNRNVFITGHTGFKGGWISLWLSRMGAKVYGYSLPPPTSVNFFQLTKIPFPLLGIMILAIINGLITSIILETIILIRQGFSFNGALKTASGMSLISMLSMEIMMNSTDYILTGGAILNWWVAPIMLAVGFITPWPYNYWRLKKFGINCH